MVDLAILRRNIIEPLYCLKNRSPMLRYWKYLEKTQFFSISELLDIQFDRLRQLLDFVFHNNRFYRKRFEDAGFHPNHLKSQEDIRRIPLLTKEEIRQNTPDMISKGYHKGQLLQFKTGGSTGKALKLYITEECSELRNACTRRHDRWTGWKPGEPIGTMWGNPPECKNIKSKLKNCLLFPTICLDTMSVNKVSVTEFAREWEKAKPTLLFGHAHSIYILAQYVKDLSIRSILPKGIISSSMMLLPHERKVIEDVFEVKVFDRYGCEEVSLIASECERHEGMHLNIEHLFIEFLKDDGQYAKSGEPGKVVVTDLMNRAMPFIRYKIEDAGVPISRKCSCGRGLPLMKKVAGRVADFLVKKDGSRVAGISLVERTLTAINGIEQMQIVQDSINEIKLNIVKNAKYNHNFENRLKNEFQNIFGKDIQILFNYVSKISQERSGKYRFSICNIADGYN